MTQGAQLCDDLERGGMGGWGVREAQKGGVIHIHIADSY